MKKFEKLYELINSSKDNNLILMGDFNSVEDNLNDRNNLKKNINNEIKRNEKLWERFYKIFELGEIKSNENKYKIFLLKMLGQIFIHTNSYKSRTKSRR